MKTLHLKKASFCLLAGSLLTSCASTYDAIGTVNMLSAKTIDTTRSYKLLASNPIINKKNLKEYGAENINQAVNNAISKVPGGVYLTNATIYMVNGEYYAVTGSVWGYAKDTLKRTTPSVAYKKQQSPADNMQKANTTNNTVSILK